MNFELRDVFTLGDEEYTITFIERTEIVLKTKIDCRYNVNTEMLEAMIRGGMKQKWFYCRAKVHKTLDNHQLYCGTKVRHEGDLCKRHSGPEVNLSVNTPNPDRFINFSDRLWQQHFSVRPVSSSPKENGGPSKVGIDHIKEKRGASKVLSSITISGLVEGNGSATFKTGDKINLICNEESWKVDKSSEEDKTILSIINSEGKTVYSGEVKTTLKPLYRKCINRNCPNEARFGLYCYDCRRVVKSELSRFIRSLPNAEGAD